VVSGQWSVVSGRWAVVIGGKWRLNRLVRAAGHGAVVPPVPSYRRCGRTAWPVVPPGCPFPAPGKRLLTPAILMARRRGP